MELETLESINKMLKVIVALLLKRKDQETYSLKEQIEVLNGLGIRPMEIAEILGRTQSYIGKELVEIRKKSKKESKLNHEKR